MSTFRPYTEIDQKIDDLHREATRHKKTDLEQAILCLKKAKRLMKEDDGRLIDQWLRLPLFLQKAGRFDEAMLEFERILKNVRPRVIKQLGFIQQPTRIDLCACSEYFKIYDKMRLACEREKLPKRAIEYQLLYEHHKKIHAELSVKLDQENKEEYERHLSHLKVNPIQSVTPQAEDKPKTRWMLFGGLLVGTLITPFIILCIIWVFNAFRP